MRALPVSAPRNPFRMIDLGSAFDYLPSIDAGVSNSTSTFFDLIDLRVAEGLIAGCDDRAGANYVDADSSSLEIYRPGPRERPQSSLGRCIDAERRHTLD